eukprot:scaffold598_cov183-Ochromonas_danica.AAC.6
MSELHRANSNRHNEHHSKNAISPSRSFKSFPSSRTEYFEKSNYCMPPPSGVPPPLPSYDMHRTNPSTVEEFHNRILATYKTSHCKQKLPHDRRSCQNWHSKADRRRNPFEFSYGCTECPHQTEMTECNLGDKCKFSHGFLERMYHPDLYKTSMCQRISAGMHCDRGLFCAFAHNQGDLRFPKAFPAPILTVPSTPLERMVELVKSAGSDGILGSDLPKKYLAAYGEPIELLNAEGARVKMKDMLISHNQILVMMHKGAQPRYVFDENAAEKKAAEEALASLNESNANKEPATLSAVQERLISIIKELGDEGVLGSDLPKKYQDLHGEKIDISDESGTKVRLKDILTPHPDIVVQMYKQLQPRFFYIKDGNRDGLLSKQFEMEANKTTVSTSSQELEKSEDQLKLSEKQEQSSIDADQNDAAKGVTNTYAPSPPPQTSFPHVPPGITRSLVVAQSPEIATDSVQRQHERVTGEELTTFPTHKLEGHASFGLDSSSSPREAQEFASLLQRLRDARMQELNYFYLQLGKIEQSLSRLPLREDSNLTVIKPDEVQQLLRFNKELGDQISTIKRQLKEQFDSAKQLRPDSFGLSSAPLPKLSKPSTELNKQQSSVQGESSRLTKGKAMCAMKGCMNEGIYVCTGCREVYYCGAEHQK